MLLCSPMAKKPPDGKPSPLQHLLLCSKAVACGWEEDMGMTSFLPQHSPNQCIPAVQLSTQVPFHSLTHHHEPLQTSSCSSGKESSAFGNIHSLSASGKYQNWTKSSANVLTQLAFWLWDVAGSASERLQWQNLKVFPTVPLLYPEAFQVFQKLSSFPHTQTFLLTCHISTPLWRTSCQKQTAEKKPMT